MEIVDVLNITHSVVVLNHHINVYPKTDGILTDVVKLSDGSVAVRYTKEGASKHFLLCTPIKNNAEFIWENLQKTFNDAKRT